MQLKKFSLVTLLLIFQFILITHPLFSSEIDQFTNREKYQDSALDFTEILNQYTNSLILQGVNNFNEKNQQKELTFSEIHQKVAFEIYMTTAGNGSDEYFFPVPSKVNLPYALLFKSGQGTIQKWIKREENNRYWIYIGNNIYSDTYPDAFNINVTIKVGGEFIGSDKVDHFFDQGYSYFVKSNFGLNDELAKEYGRDSEYGWYGLASSGVLSFADLRANWGGYQFYKNLFSGENPLLTVSEDGVVRIRHSFDWSEHIDWQFDELKNPSIYSDIMKGRINKYLKENIDRYRNTFQFLEARDIFSLAEKRDTFYLTEDLQTKKANITEFKELLTAQIQTDKEIALVFSGGGGRGAYEIGVWKALSDLGFKIQGVYGTSVGAINGPGIIMNDYKKIRNLWFDISYFSVMDITTTEENLLRGDFTKLTIEDYIDVMKDFIENKGIEVTPLREVLSNIISEADVRSSDIDYGLVLFSVSNLEPKMIYIDQIPQGELIDYILASANYPLFKREEIRGEIFIDGGIYSNVPVEMAIKKGFQNIIVVDIAYQAPIDIINSIEQNFDKSLNLTFIRPREHYGSFLTFEKDISEKYLIEGYLDTMKTYGYLHGEKYYIYGSENIIKEMFNSLKTGKQEKALSILGVDYKDDINTNDLFSKLIEPVFEAALLPNSNTENINLALLETLVEKTEIEPLTVYSQREILKRIVNITESELPSIQIIEFIKNLRYGKIIEFLKYLNNNSAEDFTIPEGYADFMSHFDTLIEE